jgi:tetratricopeptide (TPR) repeat protein
MKLILTVLSMTSWLFFATAQQETTNDAPRLLKELASATTDTARIILKCRLGEAYRSSNPDTSFILATEALAKSKEINFRKGEIHSKIVLCVMYREKGDLPHALELGLDALQIAEQEHYAYGQIYAMIRVANIYILVRDVEKGISYLNKAGELLKTNYDDYQWVVVHYFLSVAYEQLNDLDAAEQQMKIYEPKLRVFPDWLVITSRLKANIAVKRNQLPLAIEYYRKSYTEGMAAASLRETATTCNAMAAVFNKLGQTDSAIFYAKEGLRLGQQLDYRNRILAASSLLAELYKEKDPKEAVRYYQIASAAKDSLYGVQKVQQLQSATIKEQERQSEIEAERLAYRNKIRQWGLLGGAAVFLIVAIILFRNNRQKQKTNRVLETTLTDLKNTQSNSSNPKKWPHLVSSQLVLLMKFKIR